MNKDKCKCDLRTKLVGDGCRYCNPQDYIDHLHDALAEREWVGLTDEEVEQLEQDTCAMEFPETVRAIESKLWEKNT